MTIDEIKEMLRSGRHNTYVGYEPSGPIHLGTLITIYKLRDMIDAGFHAIALMADIHAILNLKGPRDLIEEVSMTYWKTVFHMLGSPEIEIRLGSEFELSPNYVLDLLALSQRVTARRAWRAMSIIAREEKDPLVSHHIYPLMQALDILYLGVNVAIGGTDQRKIHALARDVFSMQIPLRVKRYVPSAIHIPLLPGLTGGKMSSSLPRSHIAVHDPPEVIKEKIKQAYCPPGSESQYDIKRKIKNPILGIFKYFVLPMHENIKLPRSRASGGGEIGISSYNELERSYIEGKVHPLDLKNFLAEYLIREFSPVREKLLSDKSLIKPLYRLQKCQKERGLFGELEWKDALKSYYPYLGESIS